MRTFDAPPEVVTVTLNPAIDRTIIVSGLTPGAVNRAEHSGDRAGGKGVNVAAALAEQGHAVEALGFLGRDNDAIFAERFAALGVRDRCLRLPGETRIGLKIVDPARGETTDLNFPGLAPGPADIAELLAQLDTVEARWVVFAGSLPPGAPLDFYARAIERARARGARVALDTSGAPLAAGIAARPDLLKPNEHELAALLGRELPDTASVVAAARELTGRALGRVVVSRGAEGALLVTREGVVEARPPAIAAGSTVGAGDAMVAGLVAAELRGLPPAEALRLATAFALHALTCDTRLGIDPRAAVEECAERVDVRG